MMEIDGPSEIVIIGGAASQVGDSAESLETSRDRGLGDLVARITYLWFPLRVTPLPAFELTGRVKFPTGDEDRGLGTGAFQTSGQLDVYRSFGPLTPIATFGYRFFGASREFDLRDGPFASIGVAGRANPWLSAGVFFDWRRAATSDSDDLLELLPYVSVKAKPWLTFQPYAVAGFGDGSADWGAGLSVSASMAFGRPL